MTNDAVLSYRQADPYFRGEHIVMGLVDFRCSWHVLISAQLNVELDTHVLKKGIGNWTAHDSLSRMIQASTYCCCCMSKVAVQKSTKCLRNANGCVRGLSIHQISSTSTSLSYVHQKQRIDKKCINLDSKRLARIPVLLMLHWTWQLICCCTLCRQAVWRQLRVRSLYAGNWGKISMNTRDNVSVWIYPPSKWYEPAPRPPFARLLLQKFYPVQAVYNSQLTHRRTDAGCIPWSCFSIRLDCFYLRSI